MPRNWKLSPSDFAFLWEECKRCFYLKVNRGIPRPFTPFPKIFKVIDGLMNEFFEGKSSTLISTELPSGTIRYGESWVESTPITIPGVDSTCFVRGKFDTVVEFDDGSYGVVDFKTSSTRSEHMPLYTRQLHAYAYALENPAPGRLGLAPVKKLGLLCVEPTGMNKDREGKISYLGVPEWIECERNDGEFIRFLTDVVRVLELPETPDASGSCSICKYVARLEYA